MLNLKYRRTINGESLIDEKVAERFTATINEESPICVAITSRVEDDDLYRDNREKCREDQKEFEDTIYEMCDEIKKKNEEESNND